MRCDSPASFVQVQEQLAQPGALSDGGPNKESASLNVESQGLTAELSSGRFLVPRQRDCGGM